MNNAELAYYKTVCDIQDKFIRGEFDRETLEQKLEIERLKFIEYLRKQNEALMQQTAQEKRFAEFIAKL